MFDKPTSTRQRNLLACWSTWFALIRMKARQCLTHAWGAAPAALPVSTSGATLSALRKMWDILKPQRNGSRKPQSKKTSWFSTLLNQNVFFYFAKMLKSAIKSNKIRYIVSTKSKNESIIYTVKGKEAKSGYETTNKRGANPLNSIHQYGYSLDNVD